MARTYRKRIESFESYYGKTYGYYLPRLYSWDQNEKAKRKAVYYTETSKVYAFGLPKAHRKMTNKNRRAKDKEALHRFIRDEKEDVCFDPWNCKTSNAWGYW